jgi:hypothetical protein
MKTFTLTALLAIAAAATSRQNQMKELQYGFCEGASRPFTIDEVVLEPYPLVIQSWAIYHLAVGIILNEPIPVGVTVTFKIIKLGLIDIPFPCILIGDIHYGSW